VAEKLNMAARAQLRGEVAGAVADTFCRSEDLWQSHWGL
jgi:hypothetical protein